MMKRILRAQRGRLVAVWASVQEPRLISLLRFIMYVTIFTGGLLAMVMPPSSLEGEVGEYAMTGLSTLLMLGGAIGATGALPGAWWLERIAIMSIIIGLTIYGYIVVSLHITETGNRLFQFSIVLSLIISQIIRWVRIRDRPYDSDLRTFFISYDGA